VLSISVPASSFQEVPFQPEDEYRKVLAPGSGPALLERLSIAAPVVVPLKPEQAFSDRRIAEYFASISNTSHLTLVRIACGFAPPPGEPIMSGLLEVSLESASAAQPPEVVDMDPSKVSDIADLKRDITAGAEFDLVGGKLKINGGVSTVRPGAKLFLVAAGVGKSKVGWEIYDTPTMKIGGILVFNLLVQTQAGQAANGRIAVTVEVQRHALGIIPYRARLDEHPTGQFVCPP
jgi:hypothetical protein